MAKKKGRWIREREYHLSREGKKALKPQHDRIANAARLVADQCGGLKGKEFQQCRRKAMRDAFAEPSEPTQEFENES